MSAPPSIETPRLLLRAPEPGDVDDLFEIQGDREAMRHTFVAADRAATARYLEAHAARFVRDGFAPWTAVLKAERRIIGWGGLNRDPGQPRWGPEVSYFVHRAFWGRGLATELVLASLRHAFVDLDLPWVSAFTRPANAASRRVLQKAGFRLAGYVVELERDRYVIARDGGAG